MYFIFIELEILDLYFTNIFTYINILYFKLLLLFFVRIWINFVNSIAFNISFVYSWIVNFPLKVIIFILGKYSIKS